jgi:hypothetical protein
MSESAGYRCRMGNDISPMLRKQYYIGSDTENLKDFIFSTAKVLIGDESNKIGSGQGALRDDLDIDRLFAAMAYILYVPPFDGIYKEDAPNIGDFGIYEVEILEWNEWNLNNYPSGYTDLEDDKTTLLHAVFTEGETLETLEKGLKFV